MANPTIDPSDPAWENDPPGQNGETCPKHLVNGKVTVHVVYEDTRKPFEKHALVTLSAPPTQPGARPKRSDKTGTAVFTGLGHGNYRCGAKHPGYHFVPEGYRHWGDDELTLLARKKNVHWGFDTNLGDAKDPTKVNIPSVMADPWDCKWIGRYVGFDKDNHPALTYDEAARYSANNLEIVALWERSKYRAIELHKEHAERHRGHRDANVAFGALTNIKAPTHAACYFTADFDPKGNQIEHDLDLVEAYFQGVKEGAGGDTSRIGVYGTYLSIQRLYKKGLITYAWQMVFDGKGDAIDPRVNIYQYDIWQHDTMTAFGVAGAGAVDLDCAVTPTDYGAFGSKFVAGIDVIVHVRVRVLVRVFDQVDTERLRDRLVPFGSPPIDRIRARARARAKFATGIDVIVHVLVRVFDQVDTERLRDRLVPIGSPPVDRIRARARARARVRSHRIGRVAKARGGATFAPHSIAPAVHGMPRGWPS